jgi:hypothetical protein
MANHAPIHALEPFFRQKKSGFAGMPHRCRENRLKWLELFGFFEYNVSTSSKNHYTEKEPPNTKPQPIKGDMT